MRGDAGARLRRRGFSRFKVGDSGVKQSNRKAGFGVKLVEVKMGLGGWTGEHSGKRMKEREG